VLCNFAEKTYRLDKCPKGSKTPLRAHLLAVYEQSGVMPSELEIGEPPLAVAYLLGYLDELNSARQSAMALNPISYGEIQAWANLTQRVLNVWEVHALKRLDLIYLNVQSEE
jgi:hypothetical protein